jgi:hypothetical protein
MGQSPSWKANTHSENQEIRRTLWTLKVRYSVQKSLPLVSILSQMHPVHIFPPYFPKVKVKLSLCLTEHRAMKDYLLLN